MEKRNLFPVLTDRAVYAEVTHHFNRMDAHLWSRDPAHIHDCCEVYFHITGDVSFSVENTIYPVQPGDIIITKPHEVHYCIYNSNCSHHFYCLWLRAGEPFSSLLAPFYERQRGEGNRISLSNTHAAALREYLDILQRERKENNRATIKSAAAVLNVLDLLNDVKGHAQATPSLPSPLNEILSFLSENLHKPCSVQSICDKFFISRSSLARLFRRHLNTTPTAYIENKRLALSKQLLEEDLSVLAVCEACGFPDYSHFIALFKSRFGVTPLQYRKSCKTT